MNNLWTYIEGLALSQKNRKWLAGKLLETKTESAADKQKEFIKETITTGFREQNDALFAGKNLSSLDSLIQELKDENA